MSRFGTLLSGLLVMCVSASAGAQAPGGGANASPQPANTWSARSKGGMVLVGTFTVTPDSTGAFVTGTWTLNSAQGAIVAEGAWSASKSRTGWSGAWRSVVAGSNRQYLGTWTAATPLRATATLPQLFLKKSIEQVVSGTWDSSGNSGAWSIRIAPEPAR